MFIAKDVAVDDPELVDYGGPLMQWHVHENLCWALDDDGKPEVVGLTDAAGNCPPGTVNAGGSNPMVHVWIAPHECGPFAALEGHGAGQAADDGARADQCAPRPRRRDRRRSRRPSPTTRPSRSTSSGVAGVTPEQQAFAENLVGRTLVDLPQWADPAVAEAAGFHSIGDAGTGHEHYIQWDWINDDVCSTPTTRRASSTSRSPTASKKLVSAMYMLPTTSPSTTCPDSGGALMQWHVHDDLCFTDDPVAPQVARPHAAPTARAGRRSSSTTRRR